MSTYYFDYPIFHSEYGRQCIGMKLLREVDSGTIVPDSDIPGVYQNRNSNIE